jgi:hypothetical protein
MQTTDIGRAFFHVIHVKRGTPTFHMADTVEIEAPYRRSRSLVIRLTFRRALVLGWWRDTSWSEEKALMEAVAGWGIDPYDDSMEDPEVKQLIRSNVASQSKDVDSEWHIISALGVDA